MLSPSQLAARFQSGLTLHQQGRLAEAAKIYEEVLAANQAHSDALHWLGVIAFQTGDLTKAFDLISRSLAINPGYAIAHLNLGNVLRTLGRPDEALASYDKAGALSPDYAGAHNNRGLLLTDMKRFDEALASFDRTLALKPDYSEAHTNRGIVLSHLKRFDEAVSSYNKAIGLKPDSFPAHHNRGLLLTDMKRFDEALASFDRTLALKPDYSEAHTNRGIVLSHLKRFDEAVSSYNKAIGLKPDSFPAHHSRGLALYHLRRFSEAEDSFERGIALQPDYVEAHYDRGVALIESDRFEEALRSFDHALALHPDFAEAQSGRGCALGYLGQFDKALAAHNEAVALKPELAVANFNRSELHLMLGDYQAGWKGYEWRKRMQEDSVDNVFLQPRLTSLEGIQGKSVYVYWEQGLGDTLQFFRYVPLLRDAGARVLFGPQPQLKALLSASQGGIAYVDTDDPTLSFDCQVPLISLPTVFGTQIETIPANVPYIFADQDQIGKWRRRIGADGFRIGICWQGSASFKYDASRSFSVSHFAALAGIAGVRLISLHKGDGERQLKALPAGMTVETLGNDFDSGPDAFVDTAAVMKGLDLVITSDTSIAHLAGALGVPTWVALQHVANWRWLLHRADSPWYPTMRLFRQRSKGDWAGVFDDIKAALIAEIETRR